MGLIAINCANGLGGASDQTSYLNFHDKKPNGLSFTEIRAIAKNNFLCAKALEFKSQTPVKNWREWKSNTDNPFDASKIEALEDALSLKEITEEALYHMYKWGGCLVMMHTDIREGIEFKEIDLSLPLDKKTEKVVELTIIPFFKISKINVQDDITKRDYLKPKSFVVRGSKQEIHTSRVLVFKMATSSDYNDSGYLSLRNFFGFSIFEAVEPLIKLVEANNNTLLDLSMDSQRTVQKISDIQGVTGTAGGIEQLKENIAKAEFMAGNKLRSVIGGNDDLYVLAKDISQNLSLQQDNYLRLAGALGLPEILAFGESLSGLSQNAGEYLDLYFTPIIEFQKSRLSKFLKPLDEILISELGLNYDDQTPEWRPLEDVSEKEKQEIKSLKIFNLKSLKEVANLTQEEVIAEIKSLDITENKIHGYDTEEQFSLMNAIENLKEEKKEDAEEKEQEENINNPSPLNRRGLPSERKWSLLDRIMRMIKYRSKK